MELSLGEVARRQIPEKSIFNETIVKFMHRVIRNTFFPAFPFEIHSLTDKRNAA